jgi:thiol-disulfide isomerase/thioredoxin
MQRSMLILSAALLLAPLAVTAEESPLAIGKPAPDFTLQGVDGRQHSLTDTVADAKATVVVFTCNTCPFSQAYEPILIDLARAYEDKGVRFLLINSNDPQRKPGDSFEAMVERAKDKRYPFPYLHDTTQEVARSYGAQVTPHTFVLDAQKNLRYRGRINDNRDPEQVQSHDLTQALDALLSGKQVPVTDTRAFGCSIKWKKASS